jgi:hypothetical protein
MAQGCREGIRRNKVAESHGEHRRTHSPVENQIRIFAQSREGSNATMIEPLPIGTAFDDSTIVEVVQYDPSDDYQPFLYLLANGVTVWIPATGATQ